MLFWGDLLDTNLKGYFWGCKIRKKKVMKSKGSIINISSLAGKRGSSNNSAYVASKFGVNGLTQSLAKELGPRNIRVNAVCPVLISTDGLIEALDMDMLQEKGSNKFYFKLCKINVASVKDANSIRSWFKRVCTWPRINLVQLQDNVLILIAEYCPNKL